MKFKSNRARICSLSVTLDALKERKSLKKSQVRTNYGIVEGKRYKVKDVESDCFLGVPYARPPVGELRFKKPVAPEVWQGVRNCHNFGSRSVQNDMFWDKFTIMTSQNEDCLYLNIFAPAIQPDKSYPVMFYIHGGGFMMDSAVRYTPRNMTRLLVSRGIVVVTIQYRLGYLGYLCTGDEAAKGNYGLWDQYQALKWTKENIHYFGGDPDQITVAGQSAGAVSTDLLSMSPISKDMFKRKIVMGASSFCHWATTEPEEISAYCRKKALKLGWKPKKEGYSNELEENKDMVEYLRTVPAHKFGTHMIGSRTVFEEARLPLAPVIDGEILPEKLSILRERAPPKESICGVGEEEALLFIALGALRCNEKDFDRAVNMLVKKTNSVQQREILEAIRKIYGETSDRKEIHQKFVNFVSDIVSNYACYQYMKHSQLLDVPCYSYSFDYTSRRMWGWLVPLIPHMAGTHSSEIIYLFDCNYFTAPLPMDSMDKQVSYITSTSFAEFVKKGNPNNYDFPSKLEWQPVAKTGEIQMYSISEKPKMKNKIFGNRMAELDQFLTNIHTINAQKMD